MQSKMPPHLITNMKGPPKFEVGLRPIALENWLMPDDQLAWLEGKNHLLNTEAKNVYAAYDDSLATQTELAQLIIESVNFPINSDEPPLIAASRLVSDDLIIMDKREGEWKLVAATLCAPTFFDANYALGKSLTLLHDPIPTGNFNLSDRIARIFDNLANDIVLERFNWTIQWSDRRYTPAGQILRDMAQTARLEDAKTMLFERVERQTIRRLPKTGAIVFTIRIRQCNLWDLLQNNDEAKAFENAWKNAPQNVRDYKKWQSLERHVEYLLKSIL
jgi:dimethylamine monooxygenase subunit A